MGSMIKNDLEKNLSLLNFALQKEGRIRGAFAHYEIFRAGDIIDGDCGTFALIEVPGGDQWRIGTIDRGEADTMATFETYSSAADYFYAIQVGYSQMRSHLPEWQEETGLEF